MSNSISAFWEEHIQPCLHSAKQIGIIALGLLMLAVLETYSAWYAFASAPAGDDWLTVWGSYPRAALLHSMLSVICGLLAFTGMAVAGGLKDDERKRFSSRAWSARLVAICLLAVPAGPIANLAGAFALDAQQKQFQVYRTSPAFDADVRTVGLPLCDMLSMNSTQACSGRDEREAAAKKITPPSTGDIGFFEWLTAVALHGLTMWVAAAFRLAPPITAQEREILLAEALAEKRRESAKKGAATRKRNAAKGKTAKPKGLRVFTGGKQV
jgi:hypothetical protein